MARKYGDDQLFTLIPSFDETIGGIRVDFLIRDTLDDIKNVLAGVARSQVPVDTGELRATAIGEFGPRKIAPGYWRAGVGLKKDPKYGIFVHDGTGIYGPRKSPIVPRTAPYLKFTIGDRHFRLRSVKGQEAQPFMDEAFFIINRFYVPFKVQELKTRIKALLKEK